MANVDRFMVKPAGRPTVEIYLVELPDGRVVARTREELTHAPAEVRIAAGLEPLEGEG